jgi:hypothetical protein
MKQKIKKFKLEDNQRSICDQMDKEAVERLNADEKRINDVREHKIKQEERAEWFDGWARQNAAETLSILTTQPLTQSKYIIHYSPTKVQLENK